jgi:hypothetical protein
MRDHAAVAVLVLVLAFTGAVPAARAQDRIPCDSFMKNPDGSWVALNNTDIPGLGRKLTIRQGSVLRPGATILSIDMAAMLDEQCPSVLPTTPAAPPQPDLQQKYADPGGNIDIATLTCGQLTSSYQEDAEFVLLWSSGWYNGLARRTAMNMPRIKEGIRNVIAYCQANKDKRLTEAINAVMAGERR